MRYAGVFVVVMTSCFLGAVAQGSHGLFVVGLVGGLAAGAFIFSPEPTGRP